jgi:signal transduction histidine kinase
VIGGPDDAARAPLWRGLLQDAAAQLRLPLASLGGWIDLLDERGANDPEVRGVLTHVRAEVGRLEQVARRIDRLRHQSVRDAVEPAAVLARVADHFRARVPLLAHRFVIAVEPSADAGAVRVDPVLIDWVVELLVETALDALAGRGGRVTLCARRLPDGDCRIRVSDDWPGAAAPSGGRPFDGASGRRASAAEGGLPLARRIVEEHGVGRLEVVATDRGTAFDVIIP